MRLSYVLLAAATTLLVSCNAALAAAHSDQTTLSSMATADLTVANKGVHKRLLRTGKATAAGDDDLVDLSDLDSIEDSDNDEEERRIDFSTNKLTRMLNSDAFRLKKFAKWDKDGRGVNDVKKRLDLTDTDMVWLLNRYRDYLGL